MGSMKRADPSLVAGAGADAGVSGGWKRAGKLL